MRKQRSNSREIPKTGAELPDGTFQKAVDALWQCMSTTGKDVEDFGAFESQLLELSNELCRQVFKKNSKT